MTEAELKKHLDAAEKSPQRNCGSRVGSSGKGVTLQACAEQVVDP